MKTPLVRSLSTLSLCAAALAVQTLAAQASGPFASLSGSWSGGGTISMTDGHNERIRCKAAYDVAPSGIILHQTLRCASDSYKFEISSSLQADNDRLFGSWTELTRQVTGEVTGRINGNRIATSVAGTGFSATLDVVTRGNAQTVSIAPQGTDIRAVQIQMTRS